MNITLKAARVNNDLTLAEASEKLGVNINTLQNWETEKTYPDVPAIKKIEKVYGISFSNIFFSKNLYNINKKHILSVLSNGRWRLL